MSLFRTLLAATCMAGLVAPSVAAVQRAPQSDNRRATTDRPRDQDRAFRATREGRSMPLPMIERRVMPHMGGADYLGPELKGNTYRLKFMRNGRVFWIDVDPETGKIVGRSK